MALSKHKRLEAGLCRIHVICHDKDRLVQLLALFDADFVHADARRRVLRTADVFERDNDGRHGACFAVCIGPVKFSLPPSHDKKDGSGGLRLRTSGTSSDQRRQYICCLLTFGLLDEGKRVAVRNTPTSTQSNEHS